MLISIQAICSFHGFLWLKALDEFGNSPRPVFSLGVSQHKHNNNKFGLNIGHRSCKKIMKRKKTPFALTLCAFGCIRKYFIRNEREITSVSKTKLLLQREPPPVPTTRPFVTARDRINPRAFCEIGCWSIFRDLIKLGR